MPGPKRVSKRNSYILGREHSLLGSAETGL
jgi:hypothetical protein